MWEALIYDMRTYDLKPGSVPEYMNAVEEVALKIRQDYGIKLAGWYYIDIGHLNRIVHIWIYRDYSHFEESRKKCALTQSGAEIIYRESKT